VQGYKACEMGPGGEKAAQTQIWTFMMTLKAVGEHSTHSIIQQHGLILCHLRSLSKGLLRHCFHRKELRRKNFTAL